ncbi:MAG TPA: tetratricopeptide repeat protein [Solirubrobacteraceae bacterium]|nr:tetratricopeptide repeat protein [Solirubrobacteraceae bacterium]
MPRTPSRLGVGEAELLNLLAMLAPVPLPRDVLVEHRDGLPPDLRAAIDDGATMGELVEGLAARALIVEEPAGIFIAPTTRIEVQRRLAHAERRRWAVTAVDLLYAAFPEDGEDVRAWPVCDSLLDHATSAVAEIEATGASAASAPRLLHRVGVYLHSCGRWFDARECLERALILLDRSVDASDAQRGVLSRALGEVLCKLGEDLDGLRLAERALELHRAGGGPQATEVARDRLALARIYESLERLDAAEAQVEQAIEILSGDASVRREEAQARQVLGWVLLLADRPADARGEIELALSTLVELGGADDRYAAVARRELGVVLLRLRDVTGARRQLERALGDTEAALGPDHPEVAVALSNLADVYFAQNELGLAREHLERSLSLANALLPTDHPTRRGRHRKLARVLERAGDLQTAREHRERALAIAERLYGPDDSRLAQDLGALGELLARLGDHRAARAAYGRALYIAEVALGADHTFVNRLRVLLAEVSRTLGDTAGALAGYRWLMDAHRRLDEPDHRMIHADRLGVSRLIARLGEDLAGAYELAGLRGIAQATRKHRTEGIVELTQSAIAVGDPSMLLIAASTSLETGAGELAVTALERLTALRDDGLAEDASRWEQLTLAWWQLGRRLLEQGRYEGAGSAYDRGLEVVRSRPRPDPHVEGLLLRGAGDVRRELGDLDGAIELYLLAIDRKRRAGNPGSVAIALRVLAEALEARGSRADALDAYEQRLAILRTRTDPNLAAEAFALRDIARVCDSRSRAIELSREAVALARGADDPGAVAAMLHSLGRLLERGEDFAGALVVYGERLSILTSLPTRDHQSEGVTLHDIADVHRALGKADEAIALYGRAVRHKRLADQPSDLATTLLALGQVLEERGDEEAALRVYEERLGVLASLSPRDLREEGVMLAELARIQFARRSFEQAEGLCGEAIGALREGGDRHRLVAMLMLSASLLLGRGDDLGAGRAAAEAVELLQGMENADRFTIAMALGLRARTAAREVDVAFDCLAGALAHLAPPWGERPLEAAALTSLVSNIYGALGDSETACMAQRRARVALWRARPSGELMGGESANELLLATRALLGVGEPQLAREALQQATGLEGAARAGLASGWHQVGRALALRGESPEADTAYGKALELMRAGQRRDRHAEGVLLHDIGDLRRAEGRLEDAIELYRAAADAKREGENFRDLAATLLSLGRSLRAAERPDEAVAVFEEQLSVLGSLHERDRRLEGIAWRDIAEVRLVEGRLEDAKRLYRKALTLKRHAGVVDPLDTTLLALARVGRVLRSPSTRKWVAQADDLLRRGEASFRGRWWIKDARLSAQSSAWPPDGRRAWDAAERLRTLTAPSVAWLTRLRRVELGVGIGWGALPNGGRDCEHRAARELEAAGLVRRAVGTGRESLTARGRGMARLLSSGGAPPPGIAARLGMEIAGRSPCGVDVAYVSSCAALMAGDVVRATELLEGLDAPSPNAGVDGIAPMVAWALRSGCYRWLRRTGDADRVDGIVRPWLSSQIAGARDAGTLTALAGAALNCDDLDGARRALELLAQDAARRRADLTPSAVEAAVAWHALGGGHEAAGDVERAADAYSHSAELFQPMSVDLHGAVMWDAADMFRSIGDVDHATEAARRIGFEPRNSGLRVLLGIALLRFSRVQRLVEGHLPALTAAMRATYQLRFAIAPQRESPGGWASKGDRASGSRGIELDRANAALDRLSPPAIALLDLLAQDAEESRVRGIVPGLFVAPEDAWVVLHGAAELEAAGLLRASVPATSIALADRGIAAARLLVDGRECLEPEVRW